MPGANRLRFCFRVSTAPALLRISSQNSVGLARTPGNKSHRAVNRGGFGGGHIKRVSALPRQDYACAEFELSGSNVIRSHLKEKIKPLSTPWPALLKTASGAARYKRQVLFIKGAGKGDATYFIFRDSVKGGQPTVWNMWSLSRKLGATRNTKNLEAFLADAPGARITGARRLDGDRLRPWASSKWTPNTMWPCPKTRRARLFDGAPRR